MNEMTATEPFILHIPDVALEKIFSFLTYDAIANNRLVCQKFNDVGSRMLSRGFIQLEKRHSAIYKRVKSLLPRRESERKVHPLARHCDILQAVETRLSMLNMTYMKYIESNLLCFIPGKVLDEMFNILRFVESDCSPPRTHQFLQEMRDLSSMAMEHFDEHILPRLKERREQIDERKQVLNVSFHGHDLNMKPPKSFKLPQVNDFQKIKRQCKLFKNHIAYMNRNTQKLMQKMKRQNRRLKEQSVQLRDQERKIQEHTNKIHEQEAIIVELRKHMDEWDQKHKEMTIALVRTRDSNILKTPSSRSNLPTASTSAVKFVRPSIRPRMPRLLSRNYGFCLDLERKRQSSLLPEIPIKKSRIHESSEDNNVERVITQNNSNNLHKVESDRELIFSFENLVKSPSNGIPRKRKMPEDIDLS